MRIDAIDLFYVSMPLIEPWRTAYGEDAAVESILVRMSGGGAAVWAESSPLAAPCYSPEWAAGVFACLRDWLAPAIVGQSIASGEELQARLAHFKGNPFAKGALDNAWWVLEAVRRGEPLHRLLGGTRDVVEVGANFGVCDSLGELVAAVGQAFDAGYRRVKLKIRRGWDVEMLRVIRREFPTQAIHVDCNAGYTLDDLEMFCRLDDFCLEMIEQPLAHDDLVDHAELQATIRTPVCLDESINSLRRAEQAIRLGSCRFVNLKPGRVGGLTVARAIHDACREAGVACWVGGMLESAVGARLCLALATLDNCTYPADLFPSARFFARDVSSPPLELMPGSGEGCFMALSDVPGTGAEPDLEMLENCCLARAEVRAGS